jgi:hypothetical protein
VSAKLLFDECVGKPIVDHIASLLALARIEEKAELSHILEFQAQGVWDEVWIPKIKAEGRIIVTGDGGRKRGAGKGEKLPRLCATREVTHVILSPQVHGRRQLRKLITILSVWHELIGLAEVPAGSRYFLEPLGENTGKLVKRLVSERDEPPPPPGHLFRTEI